VKRELVREVRRKKWYREWRERGRKGGTRKYMTGWRGGGREEDGWEERAVEVECVVFPVACFSAGVTRKWLDQRRLLPPPSLVGEVHACHTQASRSPPRETEGVEGKEKQILCRKIFSVLKLHCSTELPRPFVLFTCELCVCVCRTVCMYVCYKLANLLWL